MLRSRGIAKRIDPGWECPECVKHVESGFSVVPRPKLPEKSGWQILSGL